MATFSSPTDVVAGALAKSSDLNNLDAATAAAFALLPTNAGINAGTVSFAVDTGTANAYLVALPMTAAAYGDGLQVVMRPLYANTGACTINVDSLGVKSIKTEANTTPAANDIMADVPVELRYSTSTGYFHIIKNSAAQATAAAASAAAAVVSAAAALVSQGAASSSQSAAAVSAAAALVSQNAAAASETAAGLSKTAAELAETNAETAETNAELAETNAETAETNAAASAAAALVSKNAAGVSAAAALVSENNTATLYDNFDDRYLGAKASDPSLDNDGNALIAGALFFNTTSSLMKVYSGSAWLVIGASEAAGDGIDVTYAAGQVTISVDLKANGGLVIEATEIAVDLGASSITGTLAIGDGGTGRATSTTAYGLLAAGTTATGAHQTLAAGLATQILVGGGVSALPAWGTDIPTAVTIGSAYIYRAAGTDVPVTDGGTGVSTFALNGILFGNAGSAIGVTAIGAEGQLLRVGASPFVPAWTTATFASTYVIGGLLHAATANTIAALAPGAVGSFLMSNGASAALSYLAAGAANYCLVGAGVTTIPVWTAATGTGAPVLATSPTFVTPALGTPASGNLANTTGYPGLAITAGKTITVTQNTALDEAVAMSSKINRGAESLKVWTYTHLITADEDTANEVNMAITAVTLSKVRAVLVSLYATTAVVTNNTTDNTYTDASINSTTNLNILLGVSSTSGRTLCITIIEAV